MMTKFIILSKPNLGFKLLSNIFKKKNQDMQCNYVTFTSLLDSSFKSQFLFFIFLFFFYKRNFCICLYNTARGTITFTTDIL
jgi:hypothetical protein